MEYTDLTDLKRVILGSLPTSTGAGRSKDKLHLTDVISFIQEEAGTAYTGKGFSDMPLTQDVGFIWETVSERMVSDRQFSENVWAAEFREAWKSMQSVRSGEVEADGIVCSPDGTGSDPLNEYEKAVHEYKCTWKSSKNHPTEDWRYMTQVKGYCYAENTPCAVMQIMYLMGNYKGSGPVWLPVRIVFSDREIEENWQMIKNNAACLREKLNGEL